MSRDGSRLPPPLLDAMRRIDGLLQQGEFRSAQAQLETVIRDHPEFVEAQRLLAGTRLASGDPAGAEALLRHAMSIAPDWTPTLTMLGELLLNAGRCDHGRSARGAGAGALPQRPSPPCRCAGGRGAVLRGRQGRSRTGDAAC